MKYKVGDVVVPHEFDSTMWLPAMIKYVGPPQKIVEIFLDNTYLLETNDYYWPESVLTPYEPGPKTDQRLFGESPKYDLKEFVLAALTGLCTVKEGVHVEYLKWSYKAEDYAAKAIEIAKATINELNKEA